MLLCKNIYILPEIIEQKTTPEIAENVIQFLINSEHVEFINTYYRFELISADRDDNKFVDCAIAANAIFIVSNDNHYKPLRRIAYPKLSVIKLMEFVEILRRGL